MGQRAAALRAGQPPEAGEAALGHPADGLPGPVRVRAQAGEYSKFVFLSGAGLLDVNGTYELATPFARAEVFVKNSIELGMIYIRIGVFGSSDVLKFSVKSREVTLGQATLEHSKIYPKGFIGDIPLNMPGWTLKGSTLSLCITPSDQEVPGIHCEVTKGAGRVGLGAPRCALAHWLDKRQQVLGDRALASVQEAIAAAKSPTVSARWAARESGDDDNNNNNQFSLMRDCPIMIARWV
ncbi:unnamed protein product [Prorocentrum cordatum]|uniref:Uncharacterized protein n=1 Tax=Prorocentrum cordatum TaxID=2364126 RepID=A0ABN9YBI0_9DINO|nr:unnamed protein product [Polarella glacialis]